MSSLNIEKQTRAFYNLLEDRINLNRHQLSHSLLRIIIDSKSTKYVRVQELDKLIKELQSIPLTRRYDQKQPSKCDNKSCCG